MAGHSWNVAASNLDDTFGSMDGYTAIVYPGTAVEPVAGKGAGDAAAEDDAVGDAADGKESAEGAAAGKEADAGSPDAPGSSGGKDATGTAGTASVPGTDAGESLLGSKKKDVYKRQAWHPARRATARSRCS